MKPAFTEEETRILKRCNTPEKTQAWIDGLKYNWERDGQSTLKSFRRVVRHRNAHCLEGALTAAAICAQHGDPPLILCMEARDIDHNLFVYRRRGKWGSLAQSRDPNLRSRPPVHATLRDLVLAYHPYYWNYWTKDQTDLTLRGFALVDLRKVAGRRDWVTSEDDPSYIEDHLWRIRYDAIWPIPGRRRFVSPRRGKLRWV
jgi:hypothetical protein